MLCVELTLVKLLPVHRYTELIFYHILVPSEIWLLKQNITLAGGGDAWESLRFPLSLTNRLSETDCTVFKDCRFSIF